MEANVADIGRILRAVNNVAHNPTAEEQQLPSLHNLIAATRESFRPNRTRENQAPKRGRKKNNTFKRKIFLMKLAHSDFLPAVCEQKYLKRRGLGQCDQMIAINRLWTFIRIQQEIISMFPNSISDLLRMSGFKMAKCDRQKQLIHLEIESNGSELEDKLGNGMLIIIPNHDFPDNLPIIIVNDRVNESIAVDTEDSDFELPVPRRPRREARRASTIQSQHTSSISNFSATTLAPVSVEPAVGNNPSPEVIVPRSPELPLFLDINIEDEQFLGENQSSTSTYITFPSLNESANVKIVDIKRENVVSTMFELYREDEELVHHHLSVKFIEEDGVDAGGLTLELFTIFWAEIFSSYKYFVGNDILIPHVPLHILKKIKPDFQILGRILGHMMLITNSFPNKLAMYTFTALSNKTEDYSKNKKILLQDFMLLVTTAEKKLLKKALENFKMLSKSEVSRLTNLFSANNLLDIPRESDIEEQIITIAEKVIVKDTNELFTEMRRGLPTAIADFLNNIPLDDIVSIWMAKQPTAEKVMNILKLKVEYPNNQQEKTFFYLQNYVGSLSSNQLLNFLLFVTASVQMPEEIVVKFHDLVGLGRRPIVHTCTNTIELGVTYDTQQDFNMEMDIYLNDVTSFEYDQM